MNRFIILFFLLFLPSLTMADEESSSSEFLWSYAHIPFFPVDLEAVIFEKDNSTTILPVSFLEHEGEGKREFAVGIPLPVGENEILSDNIQFIIVSALGENGEEYKFTLNTSALRIRKPESMQEIRESIIRLRRRERELIKEIPDLEKTSLRLEEDAKIIGGFEKVEQVEKLAKREELELKRIRAQRDQLQRNLSNLKGWKVPTDLVKRKITLEKNIRDQQGKLRNRGIDTF